MTRTQVYLPERDLADLHRLSRERGVSMAHLIREAIRRTWLRPSTGGPIAIWDGPCDADSVDHDRVIYDET